MAKLSLSRPSGRRNSLRRSAGSFAAAGLVLVGASVAFVSADAAERIVSVGEVSVGEVVPKEAPPAVDLPALVRSSTEARLREVDGRGLAARKRVILSVALVRLETDASTRSVTAAVSVTVRSACGGALMAVLSGRARVGFESTRPLPTQSRAIDAALGAALAGIPEALR